MYIFFKCITLFFWNHSSVAIILFYFNLYILNYNFLAYGKREREKETDRERQRELRFNKEEK